jgi:hypothetical protein
MTIGKRAAAEFFGTFWLVFGGCGSAVLAAAFPNLGIGFLGSPPPSASRFLRWRSPSGTFPDVTLILPSPSDWWSASAFRPLNPPTT